MSREGLNRAEKQHARQLGEEIRATRAKLGLSATEFGLIAGVHRNTVWRWESGMAMPNPFRLERIQQFAKRTEAAQ